MTESGTYLYVQDVSDVKDAVPPGQEKLVCPEHGTELERFRIPCPKKGIGCLVVHERYECPDCRTIRLEGETLVTRNELREAVTELERKLSSQLDPRTWSHGGRY